MKTALLLGMLFVLATGLLALTGYDASAAELFAAERNINTNSKDLRLIPVNPANLTITVVNSTDISIAWPPVTQSTDGSPIIPDGYKIYYSSDPDQPWENFTYLDDTVDAWYVHTGVASDYENMFYIVTAYQNATPPMPGNFILVEGGTFNNGTSNVTISSFYIDEYELTQAGYEALMGTNPSYFGGHSSRPVEQVSWFRAIEYCNRRSMQEGLTACYSYSGCGTNPDNWPSGWNTENANHINVSCNWTANGYRLPTEMEWMFAAKGGNLSQDYSYSGSNDINVVAWYRINAYDVGTGHSDYGTHNVGTKAPNEQVTFDMSGNVYEWCWDIYDSYPTGNCTDPTGPASGTSRVLRGGGWSSNDIYCTVSYRYFHFAPYTNDNLGFRVCRIP